MLNSDAVQSHQGSSLVPEGMADATKGNGKIFKGVNSSRGFFRPDWPNVRGICVTHIKEIPS